MMSPFSPTTTAVNGRDRKRDIRGGTTIFPEEACQRRAGGSCPHDQVVNI